MLGHTDKDVVELRNSLTPKLSEAGVDLVLSGHDHIYTRTHLMNGVDPVIPAGASKSGDILIPEDNEVLYVTSTTATGGKYYDFQDENGTTHPNVREENVTDLAHKSTARWRQDYNPDYTSIDVSSDSLKLTTYNINTPYVVDQVTLLKKDAAQEDAPQEEAPTTTEKPSATTTSAAKPTTLTSVSTVTLTETSTITSPSPTVVETTKVVPTTVKQTVTPTTEKSGADTGNTPSENDANNGSHETTETDASGSSTTGIVLTVLGILFGLIAAIVAVLVNLNPQFVQDIRHKYGI
ncbi:metallophosphoesterase family protein [Corynebacterium coyleae]